MTLEVGGGSKAKDKGRNKLLSKYEYMMTEQPPPSQVF